MLRLIGVQVNNVNALSLEDVSHNLKYSSDIITNHFNKNVEISSQVMYVLPECSSVGYDDATFEKAALLAEKCESGGLSYDAYSALAKHLNVFICYGFIHRKKDDYYCVSQAVMNSMSCLMIYSQH
jgi:hypothetical protein